MYSPPPTEEQQPHDQYASIRRTATVQAAFPTSQRSHHCCKKQPPVEPLKTEEQPLPRLPEEQPQTEETVPPKEQSTHDLTSRTLGEIKNV